MHPQESPASWSRPWRLLLAETSPTLRRAILQALEESPFEVVGAVSNADDLWRVLGEREVDGILLDSLLPGPPATELLRRLGRRHASARVVILSSLATRAWVLTFKGLGARGYLVKPFETSALHEILGKVFPDAERRGCGDAG